MLSLILAVVLILLLIIVLRWAFFVRLRVGRAPFCPVCREARGTYLGIGEKSGQAYYRCPHCGNVFEERDAERAR